MNIERTCGIALASAALLLSGCEHKIGTPPDAAVFGEPNRQTMMAQVIDPDPQYDEATAPSSAEHAAQAVERYRNDKVKKPDRVRTTQGSSGGS